MLILRKHSPLLLALALLTACKFPYPPDIDDDGRRSTDGGITDGHTIDAPLPAIPLIAFTSDRAGNDDIFTMHVDGSMPINLTNHPAADSNPLWSPSGDRIAFLSTRSGTQELYVMGADGSGVTNISRGQAESPVWAPDGARIAFSSSRSGRAQLYVGRTDRTPPGPVTTESTTSNYLEADWSPDGNRIVYATGDMLVLIAADGSGRNAAGSTMTYAGPRWSPDGNRVVFLSRPNLFFEVFVMDSDGSHVTNVTNTPMANEREPWWAPSNDTLAIVGEIAGNTEIAIVTVPGGGRADRTMTPATDSHPRWSSDGSLILFESLGDVLTVPAFGPRTATNLTNDPAMDRQAVWRPLP